MLTSLLEVLRTSRGTVSTPSPENPDDIASDSLSQGFSEPTHTKPPLGKGAILAAALAAASASVGYILDKTYAHEGGYVNHPADPGGPTNYGITQKVARKWGYKGHMRDFPKHCDAENPVCADKIYEVDYMRKPGIYQIIAIDPAIGEEVYDTNVNMGAARPSRWLQEGLNKYGSEKVVVDGRLGPATHGAMLTYRLEKGPEGCRQLLEYLDARQLAEYNRLVRVRPANRVFMRGWVRQRINNVDRDRCDEGI